MTSKTFECMNPVVELTIAKGSNGNINFIINHDLRGNTKATLEKSAGAHAALAILEAAGWPNEHLATTEILRRLRELDEHVKAMEVEAKEQSELEAEALELANEFNKTDWDFFPCNRTVEAQNWLAVARRAREMSAEK